MEHILNNLFIQMLNMSITAGYCILAVLLLRFLFRKAPRKYLYVLWLVVAFRLLCPVSVSTDFSLFNLERFSNSAPVTDMGYMQYIPTSISDIEELQVHTGIQAADHLVNNQLSRALTLRSSGISLKNLLYINGHYRQPVLILIDVGKYVWLLGIAAFLMYFAISMQNLKNKVQMAVRVETSIWEFGWKNKYTAKRCDIYECDQLSSPFAMGILHPKIYLPCHLMGEQRQMILLHEQYHIYRMDYLVKPLAFFLLSIYWFHPLVWVAWLCMCKDMEMSCDEKVLELLGEGHGKEYGQTLLAFAMVGDTKSRMPLAFGEHDVKSRIKHVLNFKKPAVWAGAFAMIAVAIVLVLLGTNAAKQEKLQELQVEDEENQEEELDGNISNEAFLLYEAKNPYIGDVMADGKLIQAITQVMPNSLFARFPSKTELQTSEEPYEYHQLIEETLDEVPDDYDTIAPAALMLALTDNLGIVQYHYPQVGTDNKVIISVDLEEASNWCGVENIKEYGDSPEKVQELLNILSDIKTNVKETESADITEDSEKFMEWYSTLPTSLYEQAISYEDRIAYMQEEETKLFILAQTEDQLVTVYGCNSGQYKTRGITVDYRITPDGDSNYNYFDWRWNPIHGEPEVFMSDYDHDERKEIALRMVGLTGTGLYVDQLVIFETYETGTIADYEFTPDMQLAQIDSLIATAYDRENKLVQILNKNTPESSVPIVSIPYGEKYEGEAIGVTFSDQVRFHIGEEITMEVEPGVLMEDRATPLYGFGEEDTWEDRLLRFQVVYEDSNSTESGHFTLSGPILQEER